MPELVSNGPRIPVRLMNEVDADTVVFFCGAGISAGRSSGLPGFSKLVRDVFKQHRLCPDPVEREALHKDAEDTPTWRPQLDKALGLLERRERLGRPVLRQTVIKLLSKRRRGELIVHKALLSISRVNRGGRLITTNFDNRFVLAGMDKRRIDSAPKLPVPKPHSWSSLVHLHGRILPGEDGSDLVLTAADFGRAYLTERWASRFVTELFREFTVIFVGYSVSDPVMSYLVDALAAERGLGAGYANAYAFAPYDGTPEGGERERNRWGAKNVEPILYDCRDDHRLLAETLTAWAGIRNDPFHARSEIALNDIGKLPSGPNDPVVERAVWALENPEAARALAEAAAIEDEEEFAKLEKWLDAFQEAGLFRCAAENANPGTGDRDPAFVRLVDTGQQATYPNTIDKTRVWLAKWIARHVHVPQVLTWVLRNGGHMHPGLRSRVEVELVQPEVEIPPRLRYLWTLLMDDAPRDEQRFLWGFELHRAAGSNEERERIEDAAVMSLEPRLVVHPGPSDRRKYEQFVDEGGRPIPAIDACAHPKLVISDEESRSNIEEIVKNETVLARHAERMTGYLERALALGEEDEGVYSDSSDYRPSIAEHDQNQGRDGVGVSLLIGLVRDGYMGLAKSEPVRAANLLRRWARSEWPLLRRLALHALTEDPKADIQHAKKLLVSGRNPGVWQREMRREVLRFFRLAGTRLPRSMRPEIVRAIHAGPKPVMRNPTDYYPVWVQGETAVRLRKLADSGARLDQRSRALAESLQVPADAEEAERFEFDRWQRRGEGVWGGDPAPRHLVDATVDEVVGALENEKLEDYDFRGLAAAKPVKVACALRKLAARGAFPAMYWQRFLWSVTSGRELPTPRARLQSYVARMLTAAPDEPLEAFASAAAGFVKGLGDTYGTEREGEVREVWERVWTCVAVRRPAAVIDSADPLNDALSEPAGRLADTAFTRLLKYEPKVGKGLPEAVRPYLDAIAEDPGGHAGRIMLARVLGYLFVVDRVWARQRMIPLMDPGQSEEAGNLWYAFAWSRVIWPDLLAAMKNSFLRVLRDRELRARSEKNLTVMFMEVCLDTPAELSREEVRRVVDEMTEEPLRVVLACLGSRLKGEPGEKANAWANKVHPWLRDYWPRPRGRNTAETSRVMVEVLAQCGDAFPEAVAWSLDYLQPFEGSLYRLRESGHASQHPVAMLELVDTVVGPNGLPAQHRASLHEILVEMREARPAIAPDPRFQRLFEIAIQ